MLRETVAGQDPQETTLLDEARSSCFFREARVSSWNPKWVCSSKCALLLWCPFWISRFGFKFPGGQASSVLENLQLNFEVVQGPADKFLTLLFVLLFHIAVSSACQRVDQSLESRVALGDLPACLLLDGCTGTISWRHALEAALASADAVGRWPWYQHESLEAGAARFLQCRGGRGSFAEVDGVSHGLLRYPGAPQSASSVADHSEGRADANPRP